LTFAYHFWRMYSGIPPCHSLEWRLSGPSLHKCFRFEFRSTSFGLASSIYLSTPSTHPHICSVFRGFPAFAGHTLASHRLASPKLCRPLTNSVPELTMLITFHLRLSPRMNSLRYDTGYRPFDVHHSSSSSSPHRGATDPTCSSIHTSIRFPPTLPIHHLTS